MKIAWPLQWIASTAHFGTVYATALLMPPALKVAPPLKQRGAKSSAIDVLHHAVYALVTGLVFDKINTQTN